MSSASKVAIVVPQTLGRLFEEVLGAVEAAFVEEGASTRIVVDGDGGLEGCDLALLFAECIRLDRSARYLRRMNDRPVTVLWQSEPFPPLSSYEEMTSSEEERGIDKLLWWAQTDLARFARRFTSLRFRRMWKERIRRFGTTFGDIDGRPRRLQLGVDRFERVTWIQRATSDGWLDHVLVTAPDRVAVLDRIGVGSQFLPFGYHPVMGTPGSLERDLDVVFLGSRKDDRREKLEWLEKELGERGIAFHVEEGPCFGPDRIALMQRAKISLNLLGVEKEMPRIRLLLSMACGALVISEPSDDPSPFVPGTHLVYADGDALPDVIEQVLADPGHRVSIADAATDLLGDEASMRARARAILGILEPTSTPADLH